MILKLAALAGLGYAGYRYYEHNRRGSRAAFAGNQGDARVRDAGPAAMRDGPANWSKTDEVLDQSFPASDPPANY
jgi:hypothetical protein